QSLDGAINVSQRRRTVHNGKELTALADKRVLMVHEQLTMTQHAKSSALLRRKRTSISVVMVHQVMHVLSVQFRQRPAEQVLRSGIHRSHQALSIDRIETLGHVCSYGLVEFNSAAQRFFGASSLFNFLAAGNDDSGSASQD